MADEFTDEEWAAVRRGELAPTPRRFKSRDELDPDEELEFRRTRQLPETPGYQRARREALAAAGLESDQDTVSETAPEDRNVAEWVAHMQGRRA